VNDPREKLLAVPSVAVWSAAAETTGATLCTVTEKVPVPVSPSSSVTFTVTVKDPSSA
jgi:hypothetical protein